jgi:Sec-independent protein translocase protein TatA
VGLFSDIDWLIIVGVGAFLLFGENGGQTVRQLGRWYGRALRLKQELIGEFARAADLPIAPDAGGSLRAALLGLEPARAGHGAPLAVARSPTTPTPPSPLTPFPSTCGSPVTSWSATYFAPTGDGREPR